MLSSFPVSVAAGLVFGFLAGIGIGGGSLLMVWMTLVAGLASSQARSINLLFFIPAAVCACFFRIRQGNLNLQKIMLPAIAGSICAALFSYIGTNLETQILEKIFAALLIITGIRELLYHPKEFK